VKRSRRAQTVLGDRHDLIYEILLQVLSAACGTRPAEFFNGWARTQKLDGSEKRSSENLIRQPGQRTLLGRTRIHVQPRSLPSHISPKGDREYALENQERAIRLQTDPAILKQYHTSIEKYKTAEPGSIPYQPPHKPTK
jgi:hypothetical protein